MIVGFQTVAMPIGAQPLSVANQNGNLVIWFICDPNQDEMVDRRVRIVGTGHRIDQYPGEFVGTAKLQDDTLILHVFVEPEE